MKKKFDLWYLSFKKWAKRFVREYRIGLILVFLCCTYNYIIYPSCKKLQLEELHDFLDHYLTDIAAAFTIYFLVERGIKIMIGAREERKRDYKAIERGFNEAQREINILDTYIIEMFERIKPYKFEALIKNKLLEGLEISILILNLDTEASKQRIADLSLGKSSEQIKHFKSAIVRNTAALFKLYKKMTKNSNNRLKILLYDRTPPMSYYSWDDTSYFSLISPKGASDFEANLILSSYSIFGQNIRDVFIEICNRSEHTNPPITIEDYMVMKLADSSVIKKYKITPQNNQIFMGFEHGELISNSPVNMIATPNIEKYFLNHISENQNALVNLLYHGVNHVVIIGEIIKHTDNIYATEMQKINDLYGIKDSERKDFYANDLAIVFKIESIVRAT